jgi:hypothetical protein
MCELVIVGVTSSKRARTSRGPNPLRTRAPTKSRRHPQRRASAAADPTSAPHSLPSIARDAERARPFARSRASGHGHGHVYGRNSGTGPSAQPSEQSSATRQSTNPRNRSNPRRKSLDLATASWQRPPLVRPTLWCGSQAVRQWFAKPSYVGSNPIRTSSRRQRGHLARTGPDPR